MLPHGGLKFVTVNVTPKDRDALKKVALKKGKR